MSRSRVATPDFATAAIAPAEAAGVSDLALRPPGPASTPVAGETFANPIAPGADPWVVFHEGFYYWCASENDLAVAVYRSERLTERGDKVIVWRAPSHGPHSREIRAPELHRLESRWYVYVAASNGDNRNHRMIVLEAVADDPTGEFRFKAELYTGDSLAAGRNNRRAIDGTILELGGRRYLLWSGGKDERDEPCLYIATMSTPWTISSNRVRLCANDDFLWERADETSRTCGLNEAPQVLLRDERVFVVYSASAPSEITSKIGLLQLAPGGDPMNPVAWRKHTAPVFERTDRTWGVGNNCFVRSPDGTEDWLVFHARNEAKSSWKRAIHLQRFGWDETGLPVLGAPADPGELLRRPSGERRAPDRGLEVAFGGAAVAATGDDPLVQQVRVVK